LEDKDLGRIAVEVAEAALADFGRQEGYLRLVNRAPEPLRTKWQRVGTRPGGVDADIVRVMHATHIGVDNEPIHILKQGIRAARSDGWGGSMYATDFSDVLFGGPEPIRSTSNLGVMRPEAVNVVVHGHEPTLSEMIVAAAQMPDTVEEAKNAGADGIQLSGLCCTATEILMRHGIPVAGNFLQQELALATGVVDAMVVDVQCIMPAIADFGKRFPTRLISTSRRAAFEDIRHMQFDEEHALSNAKELLRQAIEAFKERDPAQGKVPDVTEEPIGSYTVESISSTLGGTYRPLFRPLNRGIMDGRIRGVAGAGAILMGYPVVSDSEDTPEVRPTGVTTYEALVTETDYEQLVPTCIEVRGVNVKVEEIDIPAAFEGERVRRGDMQVEFDPRTGGRHQRRAVRGVGAGGHRGDQRGQGHPTLSQKRVARTCRVEGIRCRALSSNLPV